MKQFNIFGTIDELNDNNEIINNLETMKKHYLATKILTDISKFYTAKFGVFEYCNQKLFFHSDSSFEIEFIFTPELLVEEIYEEFTLEVESYLDSKKIDFDFLFSKTKLNIVC
jgi:hypothetical protein